MISMPSDEILMKHASGVLDPALRLLVERHLEMQPETRARLAEWQQFGGHLLSAEDGIELTAGSIDRALARIANVPIDNSAKTSFPALNDLSWRWAGPGRAIAKVDVPGSAYKTYALKIAPGKAMLQHSHVAEEWTLIVQGSFRDESGDHSAGSFIEEDGETNHRPVATGDVDCICLAVMSGPLAAPGLMGKAARWLMR